MTASVINSPYKKLHFNGVCQNVYINIFKLNRFELNFRVGPGLRSITRDPCKIISGYS